MLKHASLTDNSSQLLPSAKTTNLGSWGTSVSGCFWHTSKKNVKYFIEQNYYIDKLPYKHVNIHIYIYFLKCVLLFYHAGVP